MTSTASTMTSGETKGADEVTLRYLGKLETGFQELFRMYGWSHIATTLLLSFKQPIQDKDVTQALEILVRKFQILRLRVKETSKEAGKRFAFVLKTNGPIDYERLEESDSWVEVQEQMLNSRPDFEIEPLWGLRLVPIVQNGEPSEFPYQYAFVFRFDHSLVDGISCCIVFSSLVQILNSILSGTIPQVEQEPLCLPYEQVVAKKVKLLKVISNIPSYIHLERLLYCTAKPALGLFYCDPPSYPEELTKMMPVTFSKDISQRLIERCRIEKTTVNSAATVAAFAGLCKLAERKGFKGKYPFFHTPLIDSRRYMGQQYEKAVGVYLSSMLFHLKLGAEPPKSLWNHSRCVHRMVHHFLSVLPSAVRHLVLLKAMEGKNRVASYAHERYKDISKMSDMILTNLGRVDKYFPEDCDSVFVDGLFQATTHTNHPTLFIHNLATVTGRLHWNMTYNAVFVTRETASRYLALIQETVQEMIDDP